MEALRAGIALEGKKKERPLRRSLLANTGRDIWIRTSDPLLPKLERSASLSLRTKLNVIQECYLMDMNYRKRGLSYKML
jgi:hypothetical protein